MSHTQLFQLSYLPVNNSVSNTEGRGNDNIMLGCLALTSRAMNVLKWNCEDWQETVGVIVPGHLYTVQMYNKATTCRLAFFQSFMEQASC